MTKNDYYCSHPEEQRQREGCRGEFIDHNILQMFGDVEELSTEQVLTLVKTLDINEATLFLSLAHEGQDMEPFNTKVVKYCLQKVY